MITPENHWKESPKKSGTKPESMNVKSAAITSFIVIQSVWNLGSIFHGIRTKGEIGIVREWWIFIERQTFFPVEQQQQQATASMRLIYTETRKKNKSQNFNGKFDYLWCSRPRGLFGWFLSIWCCLLSSKCIYYFVFCTLYKRDIRSAKDRECTGNDVNKNPTTKGSIRIIIVIMIFLSFCRCNDRNRPSKSDEPGGYWN